jgi:flagellar motor protein MotB
METLCKSTKHLRSGGVEHVAVHGITPTERIRAVGMGASQPIADNRTRQGRDQNRRTELIILRK